MNRILLIILAMSCNNHEAKKASTSTDVKGDPFVVNVIQTQEQHCRFNSSFNCVKPVNQPMSGIAALEIKVNGTESFNLITYDKYGRPVQMTDDYVIEVKATKVPAKIDANIIPKPK